jgi:hypothetical protein
MHFDPSRSLFRLGAAALAATLALGSGSAWAQWKWRDKDGRVQYSDIPPPASVTEQQILQRPSNHTPRRAPVVAPNASAASAPGAKAPENELDAKRRKVEEDEKAKRKAEEDKQKAAMAENCTRARANLKALEDGMRMARVNDKGEREIMDDKARADEAKRMRDIVASDCK